MMKAVKEGAAMLEGWLRKAGARAEFPHTLNASGVALPRTFATLLENHQTAAGGVRIPKALRPYLDGLEELTPRD